MTHGPGIDNGTNLLDELKAEGRIRIDNDPDGPYNEYSFTLAKGHIIDPTDPRYKCIEKAVDFITGKSAQELSLITHEHSRSWKQANVGDELNIYLDLIEDEDYYVIKQHINETREMVDRVFA
jgi:hypothetical protein